MTVDAEVLLVVLDLDDVLGGAVDDEVVEVAGG